MVVKKEKMNTVTRIIYHTLMMMNFLFLGSLGLTHGKNIEKSSVGTQGKSAPSMVQMLDKMSCTDCHRLFVKREKSLTSVKNLLDVYQNPDDSTSSSKGKKPPPVSEETFKKVTQKLEGLRRLYVNQYSLFNRQSPHDLTSPQGRQYQSIMAEMKILLDQLNQKELSFVVKYQKALHCHELFASLERMLAKDGSLKDMSEEAESGLHGDPIPHSLTNTSGSIERTPRKKVRRPREDEMGAYDQVIVVPASVGIKHGLDKLIDVER